MGGSIGLLKRNSSRAEISLTLKKDEYIQDSEEFLAHFVCYFLETLTANIAIVSSLIEKGFIVIYKHFKGGMYRMLFLGRDCTTLESVVTYMSLKDGQIWIRKESEWNDQIQWPDGVTRTRFVRIEDLT